MNSFEQNWSSVSDFERLLTPVYLKTVFDDPLSDQRFFVEGGSFYIHYSGQFGQSQNLIPEANKVVQFLQRNKLVASPVQVFDNLHSVQNLPAFPPLSLKAMEDDTFILESEMTEIAKEITNKLRALELIKRYDEKSKSFAKGRKEYIKLDKERITLWEVGQNGKSVPACELTEVAGRIFLGRKGFTSGIVLIPSEFRDQQERVHLFSEKIKDYFPIPKVLTVFV